MPRGFQLKILHVDRRYRSSAALHLSALRSQNFRRAQALQLRLHTFGGKLRGLEFAGSYIGIGDTGLLSFSYYRGEIVIHIAAQQPGLDHSARCDYANDITINEPFGLGIAELFADGHLMPLVDEAGQIVVQCMVRYAS